MMRDAETVQWIAVTTTDDDELGNSTETPAAPVSVTALVAGRASSETVANDQPAVITSLTLYVLDASITPGASDRFTVRGQTYEVDGVPKFWGASGIEVAVTRTEVRV